MKIGKTYKFITMDLYMGSPIYGPYITLGLDLTGKSDVQVKTSGSKPSPPQTFNFYEQGQPNGVPTNSMS